MSLHALLSVVAPPLCVGCGAHAGVSQPLCAECRRGLRWLGPALHTAAGVELWAPLAYEGAARALVRALKFRGALRLADAMAAHMAANVPPGLLADATLVPVPAHPARLRSRGFNQAERLAAAVAQRTSLPLVDCLERRGSRATQVGRGRAERLAAIPGGVRVSNPAAPTGKLVLVDDVITTGATLGACAQALRAAGADAVQAVAYARTIGR